MNKNNNAKLKPFAQKLRREMTEEERHLWYDFLKDLSLTVNRQKVIGNYIADFYCAGKKTVIEIDGSQHFEDKGIAADKLRDSFFAEKGITVLRYSNDDINYNFDGVCEDIMRKWGLFDDSSFDG